MFITSHANHPRQTPGSKYMYTTHDVSMVIYMFTTCTVQRTLIRWAFSSSSCGKRRSQNLLHVTLYMHIVKVTHIPANMYTVYTYACIRYVNNFSSPAILASCIPYTHFSRNFTMVRGLCVSVTPHRGLWSPNSMHVFPLTHPSGCAYSLTAYLSHSSLLSDTIYSTPKTFQQPIYSLGTET